MVKQDEIRRGVGEKLGEETKRYDREEKVTSVCVRLDGDDDGVGEDNKVLQGRRKCNVCPCTCGRWWREYQGLIVNKR